MEQLVFVRVESQKTLDRCKINDQSAIIMFFFFPVRFICIIPEHILLLMNYNVSFKHMQTTVVHSDAVFSSVQFVLPLKIIQCFLGSFVEV